MYSPVGAFDRMASHDTSIYTHTIYLYRQQNMTFEHKAGLHVTLDFNCGFARCAVREYTPKGAISVETCNRQSNFRDLFADCPNRFVLRKL